MTKFRGIIGIDRGPREISPGVYKQYIEEVTVTGEMRNDKLGWSPHNLGDTVRAQHLLSIITPEESSIDFNSTVYIEWQGRKWSVQALQYKRPRVELTLGGLYNG